MTKHCNWWEENVDTPKIIINCRILFNDEFWFGCLIAGVQWVLTSFCYWVVWFGPNYWCTIVCVPMGLLHVMYTCSTKHEILSSSFCCVLNRDLYSYLIIEEGSWKVLEYASCHAIKPMHVSPSHTLHPPPPHTHTHANHDTHLAPSQEDNIFNFHTLYIY